MDPLIIFGAKYLFALVVIGAIFPLTWLLRERKPEYLMAAAICAVFAFGLTQLAGALYFDARPFTHGSTALISHAPDNGFPSDHSVVAFAAAMLTLRSSSVLCLTLVTLAACVAVSRVLVGVHHPSDVIVGALLGSFSAVFGSWIASNLRVSRK